MHLHLKTKNVHWCIPLAGAIDVEIEYHGQRATVTLLMVEGEGPSLLARDFLHKIHLNWRKM